MRWWLRLHRYLGLILAPLLLFFATSGAWQSLHLHEGWKDGGYIGRKILPRLSDVHIQRRLKGASLVFFRIVVVTMSVTFATAALIGVGVGFRMTRPRWLVWLCLFLGLLLLTSLVYLSYNAPRPKRKQKIAFISDVPMVFTAPDFCQVLG